MCYTHSDQRARRFSALTQRSKLDERALSHSTPQAVSEQALCFSLKQQRDTRSVLKLWRQESVRGNEGGTLASASRTRKPDRRTGARLPTKGVAKQSGSRDQLALAKGFPPTTSQRLLSPEL